MTTETKWRPEPIDITCKCELDSLGYQIDVIDQSVTVWFEVTDVLRSYTVGELLTLSDELTDQLPGEQDFIWAAVEAVKAGASGSYEINVTCANDLKFKTEGFRAYVGDVVSITARTN